MKLLKSRQEVNQRHMLKRGAQKRANRAGRQPPTAEELERQRKEEKRIREQQIEKLGKFLSYS